MATRDQINSAVRDMLANGTQKPFGLFDPPSNSMNPDLPYGILLPLNTGAGVGGMEDAEEERDWLYNVICVGKDFRQCGAMSSRVLAVMTSIVNGDYVHPLVLVGNSVMWRLSDSLGPIVRSGTFVQCTDSYRIRVGP